MDSINSIITLNVGGTLFTTKIETLIGESEYFKNLLIGKDESKDDEVYFVDRDPQLFKIILAFLRAGTYVDGVKEDLLFHIYYDII